MSGTRETLGAQCWGVCGECLTLGLCRNAALKARVQGQAEYGGHHSSEREHDGGGGSTCMKNPALTISTGRMTDSILWDLLGSSVERKAP